MKLVFEGTLRQLDSFRRNFLPEGAVETECSDSHVRWEFENKAWVAEFTWDVLDPGPDGVNVSVYYIET